MTDTKETTPLPAAGGGIDLQKGNAATRPSRTYEASAWEDALWVKADPKGISDADRAAAKRRLAGAIVHRIREKGECRLRAVGAHACYKGDFCLTIARGILATYGYDMYWFCCVIDADMGENGMSGLGYITVIAGAT